MKFRICFRNLTAESLAAVGEFWSRHISCLNLRTASFCKLASTEGQTSNSSSPLALAIISLFERDTRFRTGNQSADDKVRVTSRYAWECTCRHYEELMRPCRRAIAGRKVPSTLMGLPQYQHVMDHRWLRFVGYAPLSIPGYAKLGKRHAISCCPVGRHHLHTATK